MRTGPKPKPTAIRELEGDRPDRFPEAEPTPPPGVPDPPATLSKAARVEWIRFGPTLVAMGVLTQADAPAFGIYCEAHADYYRASAKIKKQGEVAATGAGGMKLHPLASVRDRAQKTMLRVLAEFGCTPSSRSRVTAAPSTEVDPLDEMIDGRI
jgi:P27 family predicted phage terminase small subunit